MPDKHKDWIEYQLRAMLERLREGTERTDQMVSRSKERLRLSLELLKREVSGRYNTLRAGLRGEYLMPKLERPAAVHDGAEGWNWRRAHCQSGQPERCA